MNNAALNMCIKSLYGDTFSFLLLSTVLGVELTAASYGRCMFNFVCLFNFLRNCQNVVQNDYTILHYKHYSMAPLKVLNFTRDGATLRPQRCMSQSQGTEAEGISYRKKDS